MSRGDEYNVLIWAVAVTLAATGGPRSRSTRSSDGKATSSGVWWGLAVLIGGAVISAATVLAGRSSPGPEPATASEERALRRAA
jgi:hypothetical protein